MQTHVINRCRSFIIMNLNIITDDFIDCKVFASTKLFVEDRYKKKENFLYFEPCLVAHSKEIKSLLHSQ